MSSKIRTVLESMERGNPAEAAAGTSSLLSDMEETHDIRELGGALRDADDQLQLNQRNVQDIIRGLLALKDEESATNGGDSASQEDRNKEAGKTLSDACQEVERIQDEVQAAQKQKYDQEELQARLLEQRETVKEETTHILPKTRYNIGLYKCITGISWDYECPPEQIKGYVSTKTDVRPFSLSTQQNSKFFITNYLWDLVGTANDTK